MGGPLLVELFSPEIVSIIILTTGSNNLKESTYSQFIVLPVK